MDKADLTVADMPEKHRYEASDDSGVVAGFSAYRLDGDVITFTHTEVDDAFEGSGVGSTLVRGALDDARGRGLAVRPLCPFVSAWIDKHPDYADLVRD